jgi:hypothetical protein
MAWPGLDEPLAFVWRGGKLVEVAGTSAFEREGGVGGNDVGQSRRTFAFVWRGGKVMEVVNR